MGKNRIDLYRIEIRPADGAPLLRRVSISTKKQHPPAVLKKINSFTAGSWPRRAWKMRSLYSRNDTKYAYKTYQGLIAFSHDDCNGAHRCSSPSIITAILTNHHLICRLICRHPESM